MENEGNLTNRHGRKDDPTTTLQKPNNSVTMPNNKSQRDALSKQKITSTP